MTVRETVSSARRALLVLGTCALLVAVLVGVRYAPTDDRPPGGTATAARALPVGEETKGGATPSPNPEPRPESKAPTQLAIPAIDLATSLVQLGLMPDRTVEVPQDADLAGWFQPGTAPGRLGSAVILGHVDSAAGPAVFARLQELRPGDPITVTRADGSSVRFVVEESVLYPNAEFPAQRVYAAQGERRLNLVTCGGVYDATRGGYQSNLVVYARLTAS